MNADRFEALRERLLDGELAPADAEELALALKSDPARRRELRQHLVAWELWSQQQAPERSADAFLRSLHTRQRAEPESELFVARVKSRLQGNVPDDAVSPHPLQRGLMPLLQGCWRLLRSNRGFWLSTTSVAALVLVALLWLAPHQARATVTLHGEVICTACMLHETHAHLPAIRVHEGDRTTIYYVSSDRLPLLRLGDYCLSPVPIVATGRAGQHDGRRTINVEDATRAPHENESPHDERVLFPF